MFFIVLYFIVLFCMIASRSNRAALPILFLYSVADFFALHVAPINAKFDREEGTVGILPISLLLRGRLLARFLPNLQVYMPPHH